MRNFENIGANLHENRHAPIVLVVSKLSIKDNIFDKEEY